MSVSRRTFVKGLAAGGALAFASDWKVLAQPQRASQQVLTGTSFDLSIGETPMNFTGAPRIAQTINGSVPGPVLRWREGDTVTLRVANRLRDEDTSIHWHGIILPADMDGVPGLSFHGIRPGETYTYRFDVNQAGTYWYHSHSGFQEQRGVYGPLVIESPNDPIKADREHVILLSDWTDEQPERVFAKLKKQGDYYNYNKRTLGDLIKDIRTQGLKATIADRRAWGDMRMNPTDLADVGGATYTHLLNGVTPEGNWTGLFKTGERVRLRVINGSAMTYFDLRIPGLKLTVVAADGLPVHPVTVDELRVATAETFDIIVEPSGQEAFTIFAQAMDRTAYAAGTLAVREGLRAPVPALDPRPLLSMSDMGHGDDHAGHNMASMPAVAHPPSEDGNALVDMQTSMAMSKLDDPGIGLRNNGRRVLSYSDLGSTFPDPDGREPGRTIELHLTGHMEKFAWSFDGIKFSDAEPLRLNFGERLRIVLVNDTMMTHPIHLHGMWSDLENDAGDFMVRKHTIDMPPGTRRTYRVRADALGRWAYHCHLLFHMEAGMFREVRVSK